MKKRKIVIVLISTIVIFFMTITLSLKRKEVMIPSSMKDDVEKYWGIKVNIKKVNNFEAYGKKFILVLSTAINDEKYKYLNCYEEKLNGLYYKNLQASEQGGSRALINFSTVSVNTVNGSNIEDWITVVYGYNKDLQVDNYEMKISGHGRNIISNITGKEYFVDVYQGSFEKLISASGKGGQDMLEAFCD